MQKSSPLDFATREVGDDESSAPINAAAALPALKKAKKLAEKVADNGQPKNLSFANLMHCLYASLNASWQSQISGEFFLPVSMGKAEFKPTSR